MIAMTPLSGCEDVILYRCFWGLSSSLMLLPRSWSWIYRLAHVVQQQHHAFVY